MGEKKTTIPPVTLTGKALDNALQVKSELLFKGRYESSWNVVINKMLREHDAGSKVELTEKGVEFKLSGFIPDNSEDKKEALATLVGIVGELFKEKK